MIYVDDTELLLKIPSATVAVAMAKYLEKRQHMIISIVIVMYLTRGIVQEDSCRGHISCFGNGTRQTLSHNQRLTGNHVWYIEQR